MKLFVADCASGSITNSQIAKLPNEFRGVSSTVKLSVSKTELGGSNPSAPARILRETVEATGVEAKRMAKAMAAATSDGSFVERMKSWPERLANFYRDVRTEMKKVTAPPLKEVQATTVVVIVTVFLFAGYFWIVDVALSHSVDYMFRYFTHPH